MLLEARSLAKRFKDRVAVADVSLGVRAGECTGLLGPNGAGKTTTVAMIAGLLSADSGTVLVDGSPLVAEDDPRKRKIGLVPQELALFDALTARENLRFFGSLYAMSGAELDRATDRALDVAGLKGRADDLVKPFSGGMKRRLNLAASLLHDPDLLILDEPTVGVDPQSRSALFDVIEALRAEGKGILYTTHYMEEAERLCQRVVIVDRGAVVADDTLRGLEALVPRSRRLVVELEDPPKDAPWIAELSALDGVEAVDVTEARWSVTLATIALAPRVLSWIAERGGAVRHVETERADLEAIFLALTGRTLRDE
ncbi:MAG: ABC transporter ATP-binding protein [Polyangiaceae bacterium]